MKLSDYVFKYIETLGVKHVFYLPGGGAMHLDNSLGENESLNAICMLHEQSCSIAAEAYSRISDGFGVCLVTSGPGATNTITGLAGAWLDSTPVIFISGQAKTADLVGDQNIRQFGVQEINIIDIVKPITKYAVQILDPNDIQYELEKATLKATEGKPGPVWIDIPLDIQASYIEPDSLRHYDTNKEEFLCGEDDIDKVISLINDSKRPLLILGHGIRLAHAIPEMNELIEYLQAPVMTTWNGVDLIDDENPLFYGRPGAIGHRYSNIIQQKADLVITLGTRLNLIATGYNYESLFKNAKHVMVEIDANEMNKASVHPFLKVHSDVKYFMNRLLDRRDEIDNKKRDKWLSFCNELKQRFPLFGDYQNPPEGYVSTYNLARCISSKLTGSDILQFTSSGTAIDIFMYCVQMKKGLRAFLTKGLASMGFDLPASIGSCLAANGSRTICLTGDGSFMMNIQELSVLKALKLPVKLFILDNSGYGMIYNSQVNNFGRTTGCTEESGLYLPKISEVVKSFGIETFEINSEDELENVTQRVFDSNGPAVCVVNIYIGQKILPRQTNYMMENGQMASRPLEDMSPLLDEDELKSIMDYTI